MSKLSSTVVVLLVVVIVVVAVVVVALHYIYLFIHYQLHIVSSLAPHVIHEH